MRSQSQLVGISLLAFGFALPALMEASRSIKIGVLNDASGPYFDNASERTVKDLGGGILILRSRSLSRNN